MSVDLYVPFIAKELGLLPEQVKPERGPAMKLAELLWPLAEWLKGSAGPYDPQYESRAEAWLEAWEADPYNRPAIPHKKVRAVIQERTMQAIVVCKANEMTGERMLLPPERLSRPVREAAAAFLMLHRMELVMPPSGGRGAA